MFRASGILLFVALGVWLWFAIFGPTLPHPPASSAPSAHEEVRMQAIVKDCMEIVGLHEDADIVRHPERLQGMATCLGPFIERGPTSRIAH